MKSFLNGDAPIITTMLFGATERETLAAAEWGKQAL